MAGNPNYAAGRRFEYARLKHYRETLKQDAIRASGSHGKWDIIATDWPHGIVTFVQCKVVSSATTAQRLLTRFRESPPFPPKAGLHQRLEVKIKGSTDVHAATI